MDEGVFLSGASLSNMPLHDTFKKKTGNDSRADVPVKVATLRMPPSQEDLRFCMGQARQTARPSALGWKIFDKSYVLTAAYGKGMQNPTWVLQEGDISAESTLLWTYMTSDPELILSFLAQVNEPEVPKAVIPENLRPGYVDEEAKQQAEDGDGSFPLAQEEFSDNYELISRVGFGGMGVIFKARRKDNKQIVALKFLHGHLLDDPENTQRFMQEASACSKLRHRNLINVYEYGVSKRGQPYMIMEYLEGRPLNEIIENEGALELPRFINLFTQICDGLQCAHEKGVVHRDVKPSNIMIITPTEGGKEIAKVLDFGIAKFIVETENKLTPTGNVLGSPAYIAPEQCSGAKADPRCDVYALGCVMYEALAGHPPFMHESAIKVLLMQLGDPPPPLSSVCEVPPDLEAIIMHCLEKDPEKRYPSASDLAVELWAIAALRSQESMPAEAEAEAAEAEPRAEGTPVSANTAELARFASAIEEIVPEASQPPTSVAAQSAQGQGPAGQQSAAPAAQQAPPSQAPPSQAPPSQAPPSQAPPSQATPSQAPPSQAPGQAAVYQRQETRSETRPVLTIRLRKCRSLSEMDGAWEGLNLALKIQAREMPVTVFLDTEAVLLVMRQDVVASRFNLELQAVKRLSAMQGMLQQLLRGGATVLASERWAKRGVESQQFMPGVLLLNDNEICDLIIERSGSIVDY